MMARQRSLIARPEREPRPLARRTTTASQPSLSATNGLPTRTNARPPGVRHPVGRLQHWLGLASVVLVTGASITLIGLGGIQGVSTSSQCVTQIGRDYDGVRGVCGIVDATRSLGETIVLLGAIALAAVAVATTPIAYRLAGSRADRQHALSGLVLAGEAIVVAVGVLWFRAGNLQTFARIFLDFAVIKGNVSAFWRGVYDTLLLAIGGEIGGLVIGLGLALINQSSLRALRAPARAYIDFFRGTPMIWQLSVLYFGVALGLGLHISTYQTAIAAFALNSGAYIAEVFRAGIESVERGQLEAARGLGLTHRQAMFRVILPQALRRSLPPLMNTFVALVKETALVLALGLTVAQLDLYNWALQGYSNTFNASYFLYAAFGYLALTLPLIALVNRFERRLRGGARDITFA